MPLQKLQFRPGVNKEGTNYANEGGFYACDKIRFRSGYPEKLGGWANQAANYTFNGTARLLWNWVTYDNQNLLAVGTSQKFYIQNSTGGSYNDITPLRNTTPITLGTNPFSTTAGSKLITVSASGHGAEVGSYVTFTSGSTVTVGGVTVASVAGVEFEIVTVIDGNTYTIVAPNAASSVTTATGGTGVGATYQINAGRASFTLGGGWGGGGWGSSGWGSGTAVTTSGQIRLWSVDNYEQNLLFSPQGGAIYYWAKDTSTYARAVLLSTAANGVVETTTTATFVGGVTSITVADGSFIDVGAVVSGTNITAGTYVTAIFGTTVTLSAVTTGASSGSYTFSYAGRFVPNNTNQIVPSDTNHFTIALGANAYDPTTFTSSFDPMLVRWSDQDNPFDWVPKTSNQAGEQHLSNGSYLVCGRNTRQEILLWSDAALYSMQYLGPPYVFGFNLLMDNISIASSNAAITVNNVTFWMGVDKFYQYSGRVETLPCSLRQFVFNNINKDQLSQIVCGSNEGYNEIWWHYPTADSLINNRYIIYNHLERIWYYGELNRTAWLDSPLRSNPMAAFSVQNTYTTSAITSTSSAIPVVNAYSFPDAGTIRIDSEYITYTGNTGSQFTGCTRGVGSTAAAHDAYSTVSYYVPNQVLFHESGVDDNTTANTLPIVAYVESSDFDIGDGHNFGFVWRMIPDLTFDGSVANNPAVTLTVKPRQNSGSNYTAADSPSVTRTATYPVEQYTGQVYTRIRGRQMAFRIDSTAVGVTWQLGAVRIDIRPDGRR